ncbi:MAG TPA: PLP-dependent aminotransferase family protein [Rhizomicrobium sp.]|jgi:GntR family transcriptional regulator/MocR family aminotransferase|nr:PLP-dependent aminotransferase family protein [Rhizomicrobium sp.]
MPQPRFARFRFDRSSTTPLNRQLYDRIRAAIAQGRLRPGERVPSARSLAAQLGVARGTIDMAYARLLGDGLLVTRGQGGTIVSGTIPAARPAREPAKAADTRDGIRPFQMGLPALDLVPRKLWSRLVMREVKRGAGESLAYPDAMGVFALRRAIASYLALSRGIAATPEQIAVTSGYQGALDLAARLVLKKGDAVLFEDPGYGFARNALRGLGMRLQPVPVDAEGIDIAQARRSKARLAVVTPAHQAPLGVTLSPARRRALLAWARDARAFVLEDDYDCEFHYSGFKPAALKSLDGEDRVFYAGSFSKVLFPALRLGYLVLPARFADDGARHCRDLGRGHASLEQAALAAFLAEGHFARHLRRMRQAYKARRQALAEALQDAFGDGIDVTLPAGGLHIVARFPNRGADKALAARCAAHGLAASQLSAQFIKYGAGKYGAGEGLLLSFTNIAEKDAPALVARLKQALG